MLALLKGRLSAVRITLLVAALALVGVGIVTIYAVGHPAQTEPTALTQQSANLWKKQLVFAAIGIVGLAAVNLVSYRRLGRASYWIYALVLLLLAVLLVGRYAVGLPFVPERNGAHRWIVFTIAGVELPAIQPSELCKIAYVLALAWFLRYRSNYRNLRSLIGPFILTFLPTVLILFEPDLKTVLLILPVFFVMLFAAGAKIKHLAAMTLIALSVSPLLWFKMQPYQRMRISSVLLQSPWLRQKAEQHPVIGRVLVGSSFSARKWRDDWGYHLIRSKYAVASGGAAGYGLGRGPFVKYNFLPERHNDFIFAIIAHQWGFIGCIVVLALYAILMWCGLEIAAANVDPFARLLAVGIVAAFAIQLIVNVSMTVGLMPITGLTLPLVSYGGSSLLVSLLGVGLLNNIGRSRPFSVAPRQ